MGEDTEVGDDIEVGEDIEEAIREEILDAGQRGSAFHATRLHYTCLDATPYHTHSHPNLNMSPAFVCVWEVFERER